MRWSRTKDIDKAKVIATKINNPDATLSEIESETWLPISTVSDILTNDLPEVRKSSERIWELYDRNDMLQSLADKKIEEMLLNWEEKIDISKLIQLRDSTFKQNAVIWLPKKDDWSDWVREIIIQL